MAALSYSPNTLMIRKLERIFTLSSEEKQALQDLPIQTRALKPNQEIIRVGDEPSSCCLILEGFTCVYKMTVEGNRQILALHVPGDIPDLQSLHLRVLDMSIATMSPCLLGFIQHEDMRSICDRYPQLTAAFWRETLIHASILREWLLNNSQRVAYKRIAHLLCELLVRLKAVGLAEEDTFDLPVTQIELADATGITMVHMNRILQSLRSKGLIQTMRKQITVPDWKKLKEVGEFDPLYLHFLAKNTA
ncbi:MULTISPECIES: Crp/Fnr family transcriptional regulator [Halomonadaceae]|uniref:Crp/Fnr family transcriptional regulator n=1 Tax=Halomonadaceae TaxID=28256 RepID=UPI00159A8312|nr:MULTISPECIES: Crp/Fnr family transcriptional regulator [Halomonas]QJQ96863.1 Crp/Fnr family transcriptional regulator [Halomonas sp. PA5]